MNDNDKAGRYLVKRAPAEVLGWLVRNPALASISTAPYSPIIGRQFSSGERGVFSLAA